MKAETPVGWLSEVLFFSFRVAFYTGGACVGCGPRVRLLYVLHEEREANGPLARCTQEKEADCRLRKPCALTPKNQGDQS